MLQIEILKSQHSETLSYQAFLQQKFSAVKDNQNPIDCHILVKEEDMWIAGATLAHQDLLEYDADVHELWEVEKLENCTRILRLWANRSSAIPRLLHAIEKNIPRNTFVYGILSVPPRYARKNFNLFETDLQIAKPRYDFQNIDFIDEDYSTSEGRRLIQIYKQFGAQFLGPLAASPADQTIRALMGIPLTQKTEPHFWKRYETNP